MSEFNLPPELEDRLRSLGEPIAEFRTGGDHLALLWILSVGSFLMGPVFLVYAVRALRDNLAGVRHSGMWVEAVLVGLGCLAIGVEGLRRIRKVRGLRAFAFAEGLARVQDDSVDVLRWADVALVRRSSLTSSKRKFWEPGRKLVLSGIDGKQLDFDESLSRLRELRQLVEKSTLPHLFPAVLNTCEAGANYLFGEIRVNWEGLIYRGSQLPWSLCASVEAVKGQLVVKKQGAWIAFCKMPLSKVPNVHVLIAFAEYIRKYAD